MIKNLINFLKRQRLVVLLLILCIFLFQLYHYGYLQIMDPMVKKSLSPVDMVWLFFNGAKYFEFGDLFFVKELPYIWITFHGLWFYIVFKEFGLSRDNFTVQKIIREGSRKTWWRRKWAEVQVNNILLFVIFIIVIVSTNFYNFVGEGGSFINDLYLMSNQMTIPKVLNNGILVLRLLILPLMSICCMTSVIAVIEIFISKDMASYLTAFVLLFASMFFDIPILFMNYAMTIRNMNYSEMLVNDLLGIVILLGIILITYIIGDKKVERLEII
ncbi:hypothetical protein [Lagierella sp.]|uniref:hypothetical protein n=1 Tax=Lagierella sp. TaxID=2849657 RepID=UPI00263249E7|nr:hypothetical protein [Lagierella sp.]